MSDLAKKAKIREYYDGLGSDVAEVLAVHLVDRGGFVPLLARLHIPDPGPSRDSDRYAAVYAYVRQIGRRRFMEEMGGLSADFSLEAQSDDAGRQQRLRILEESLRRKAKGAASGPVQPPYGPRGAQDPPQGPAVAEASPLGPPSPIAGSMTPTAGTTPAPIAAAAPSPIAPRPAAGPPLKAREAKARAPRGPLNPAANPLADAPNTPAWDPERPYDPTGTWPQVERRSGVERRTGKDRRASVELIYKNRRYGKDRRLSGERRKNWPKGGFRPEDERTPES